MKRTKSISVILLSVVLIAVLSVALIGCNPQSGDTEPDGTLSITPHSTEKIKLSVSDSDDETIEGTGYIRKVVHVTIFPESAIDKTYSREIYWVNAPAGNPDISEYLELKNSLAGNSMAFYVDCYQGFSGATAEILVRTNDGGYTATCTVTYVGMPTRFYAEIADGDGTQYETQNVITVPSGRATTINLVGDNNLHSLGGTFNNFSITKIYFNGQFNGLHGNKVNSAMASDANSGTYNLQDIVPEIIGGPGLKSASNISDVDNFNYFCDFTLTGSSLTITPQIAFNTAFYYPFSAIRARSAENVYKYVSAYNREGHPVTCTVNFVLKELTSNVEYILKITISSGIESVSLNSTLEF